MKFKFFILLMITGIFFSCHYYPFATGYVFDERTRKPLSNVTCSLYTDLVKKELTDSMGKFLLKGEMQGRLFFIKRNNNMKIQFSHKGYHTKILRTDSPYLGKIYLQSMIVDKLRINVPKYCGFRLIQNVFTDDKF